MDQEVSQQLLQLNNQFYQTFAGQFSATRQRLQPGVRKVIESLPNPARILDLGCGNGELALQLAESGQRGTYVGLDNSPGLLQIAQKVASPPELEIHFYQADLSSVGWNTILAEQTFDVLYAFAVLHHLPGVVLRQEFLTQVATCLAPGGVFIHSAWQFLNSPRLRARFQPWQSIGLMESQLESGDYLLDWRGGGSGLRYVHHFSSEELHHLAGQTGFQVLSEFTSDGEGGRLGLYQIWKLA